MQRFCQQFIGPATASTTSILQLGLFVSVVFVVVVAMEKFITEFIKKA